MRHVSLIFVVLVCLGFTAPAQDAATTLRLNELAGKIENLLESQETQRKQIAELSREIDRLREQMSRPQPESASMADLRRVADAVQEVDRKRLEDYEKIRAELLKLGKTLSASTPSAPPRRATPAPKADVPEKGFYYEVKPEDTLSAIVAAYRAQNINVSVEEILKANPGLKPERLIVGRKIFIPAPTE